MDDLDELYMKWSSSQEYDDLNALIAQVIRRARILLGDEDAAQDVGVSILRALPRFKLLHKHGFRNFVFRHCRGGRIRLIDDATESNLHDSGVEVIMPDDDEPPRDYSQFSDEERKVIRLLEMGYSRESMPILLGFSMTKLKRIVRDLKGRCL